MILPNVLSRILVRPVIKLNLLATATPGAGSSATSTALTITDGVQVNSTIIFAFTYYTTSGTAPTITDTGSNTYTNVDSAFHTTNTRSTIFISQTTVALNNGDTITISHPSANGRRAAVYKTNIPVTTQSSGNNDGTSSPATVTTSGPTPPGSVLVGVAANGPTTAASPGGIWYDTDVAATSGIISIGYTNDVGVVTYAPTGVSGAYAATVAGFH